MCFQRAASDLEAVGKQYPFEPFRWLPSGSSHVLRLNFEEAIKILQDNGFPEVSKTWLRSKPFQRSAFCLTSLVADLHIPRLLSQKVPALLHIVAVPSR